MPAGSRDSFAAHSAYNDRVPRDHSEMKWEFWIDRGGTFTDLIARGDDRRMRSLKLLSSSDQYEDAAVEGIRRLLGIPEGSVLPVDRIRSVRMGTTVATNALLERRGEPTVLLITRGFRDSLRIGYQNRPELFARNIVLPEPLYGRVIEANERIDAGGEVVEALDEQQLRTDLERAFEQGFRSIAIVFMHSWRIPLHEEKAASIAREIGFTQISTSHEVIPLMRLVGRGDTSVVDAYVSPLLLRYVEGLRRELGETRLLFMQSNGGLAAAEKFRGRDSLLSGPAGGVVGMVQVAKSAGFERVIGFDMGGTSTDVALYAGELERTRGNVVAGARVRVPMMDIHTVAAGGGSILKFVDGRFQAGPESAGADPGPACYRKGGPLTITDANVMLGRILPEYFPAVFGPDADRSIDAEIVREKFVELARHSARETGVEHSPESVAEGFLRIAVERMANAIKKISIQRGHDVTEFVLCSFGGAGGQHACRVAEVLGITTILLHPLAGVLSAYGIGIADIRSIREETIESRLDEAVAETLERRFAELESACRDELFDQGVDAGSVETHRRLQLRYEGTDAPIRVEWAGVEASAREFSEQHGRRFGFTSSDKPLVVESIELEAVGLSGSVGDETNAAEERSLPPAASREIWFDGEWREAPVYDRERLLPGMSLEGPAVLIDANSTTVLEPGWRGEITARDHLLLKRTGAGSSEERLGSQADPILLEVFNNLFMHIAEQMGAVLEQTSYSVNIKERLDFSCAVFDREGNLVANAPHMPIHLGSMGESVRTVLRDNPDLSSDDVVMLNAPYNGGTHLPDVTVVTPVFDEAGKTIEFMVASRGHHADIGGITPGSMPALSTSVEEEGVLFDNFRIVSCGVFREDELVDALLAGPYPARNPQQNIADLKAQIAANRKGVEELLRIVSHYGMELVRAYMRHVRDNAEEAVRNVLDVLDDGSFDYEMDSGSRIAVSVRVDRDRRVATVDFHGTSAEAKNNFNAPRAICRAAVLYVFRCLVDRDIPMNEGCLAPIEILIPESSLLSPRYPAAVVAGNVETSQCITNALFGAVRALAASQGTMNNFSFGTAEYQYYETICGGAGAGPDFDGASAVQTHMTNSRLTDPEVLEWRFPVRIEEFSIREGSGGEGTFRGGDGAVRRIRFLQPMQASILSGHRRIAPFGLEGGSPGAKGRNYVVRRDGAIEELAAIATVDLEAGDLFVIETPGGGGWGKKHGS
jgi:5-oxoprolinase (ATP-hydrolysing)